MCRSDLCADLVSFPADHEKQMLHHLPDLQLGPSDDVYPYALCKRFLLLVADPDVCDRLVRVGALCAALSGAVLGKVKRCFEVFGVHRQAVYPVLSEAS